MVTGNVPRDKVVVGCAAVALLAFESQVDSATNQPIYRQPDRLGGPLGPGRSLPPLPRARPTT